MPGNQKNFSYFEYTDDSAVEWCVRGEDGGPFSAVDGHSTDNTHPVWGRQSKRRHVRYIEATHATTFRKIRGIIYTAAAFAAIDAGDTIAVSVEGVAGTVNYLVSAKIPERKPLPAASRHLTDI